MTAESLSSIAGVILSLVFSYVPFLAEWFNQLNGAGKRLVMLVLLAVTTGAIFTLACFGYGEALAIQVACTQTGALELVKIFITAMIANQAVYAISPRVAV